MERVLIYKVVLESAEEGGYSVGTGLLRPGTLPGLDLLKLSNRAHALYSRRPPKLRTKGVVYHRGEPAIDLLRP